MQETCTKDEVIALIFPKPTPEERQAELELLSQVLRPKPLEQELHNADVAIHHRSAIVQRILDRPKAEPLEATGFNPNGCCNKKVCFNFGCALHPCNSEPLPF